MRKTILIIFFFALFALFATSLYAQFNVYYGNLHSHTSFSDGEQTPDDAFTYARDVAGLDFLAVTDHLEYLYIQPWNWITAKASADAFTDDGVFVAIAGYEWGSSVYNHCNVYNTPNLITPATFFDWIGFCDDVLGERPAFAEFNHPGEEEFSNNWNNFAYLSPPVDSAFPLIEVKYLEADTFYRMALDSGWHVSPVANQDNHSADWGTRNDSRAGIWATALTRPALFLAIMSRRTFSTMDKNASVWLDLDGVPMGSRQIRTSRMRLHILLDDGNSENWSSIQVVGPGTAIFLSLSGHPAHLDTMITIFPGSVKWIYLKAQQPDGHWIWSAPCFLEEAPVDVAESRIAKIPLDIQPNPAGWFVKINGIADGNIRPEFFDVLGREVSDRVLYLGENSFDLRLLPRGTYLVKSGEASTKFVLMK